jgi:hypothetical protein
MNPLKSRSTIISVVCILAFLCFSEMVLTAGYFDAGFGAAGLMFLSGVVKYVFDHQAKTPKHEEQPKEIKP